NPSHAIARPHGSNRQIQRSSPNQTVLANPPEITRSGNYLSEGRTPPAGSRQPVRLREQAASTASPTTAALPLCPSAAAIPVRNPSVDLPTDRPLYSEIGPARRFQLPYYFQATLHAATFAPPCKRRFSATVSWGPGRWRRKGSLRCRNLRRKNAPPRSDTCDPRA